MDKNGIDNNEEHDEERRINRSNDRKNSMPKVKTFVAFKNPVFRLYYGALLAQRASFNMQMVTRSYLIYQLTGSYALLGLLNLTHAFPALFASLFGGVLADRLQKRNIILIGTLTIAALFFGVAISLTTGYLSAERTGSWWVLMAAAVLEGVFSGIMMPSRQSIIPEIVGERNLMNGIALTSLAMNLLRLFAPAIAGFVIAAYDFHVAYYSMAALSSIAAILTAFMPYTGKIVKSSTKIFANIKEGFRYIRRKRIVLFILIFVLISMILSMPVQILMPVFADDILKVGASGMGILMSVSGVGGIVGSIALTLLPDKKRGLLMLASCLVLSMALIGFSFSASWPISLSLISIFGLGQAMRMTLGNTLVQQHTDSEYRGRVMSVYSMEISIMSLGTFAAAMLSEIIGVQWAVASFAMALILIASLAMIFVPQFRKLN
ncbi:MFS transporter [Chloroflexota bacterium]